MTEDQKSRKRETDREWRQRNKDKLRESSRRWRETNPERAREVTNAYRARNREAVLQRSRKAQRAYRTINPEKYRAKDRKFAQQNPGWVRAKFLKMRYRMSLVQWLAMFQHQGQCCALCHSPKAGRRTWATDHCHKTGRVRGILCHRCNLWIGYMGDTAIAIRDFANTAIAYLKPAEGIYHRGRLVEWTPEHDPKTCAECAA